MYSVNLGNLSYKRILVFLLMGIFMISMVSAQMEWDNVHHYKDNDMTVVLESAFGLDYLGEATLKSHATLHEVKNSFS